MFIVRLLFNVIYVMKEKREKKMITSFNDLSLFFVQKYITIIALLFVAGCCWLLLLLC